ncbi:endolysin [Xylella phage Paz]|uniref:Endolysin n=1 Tax=Xylella phage Paz TaxID=1415145 RepID=V5Q9M8_9CAUD|nr:endolysin [Xylella phage Paz]AHB12145.1 endolysin [Xylella phage Paz]
MKSRILALLAGSLLSVAGVVHVMDSEGIHRKAYPDPGTGGAPWTICYGHTGKKVVKGLMVSQEQCEAWLVQDLKEHEGYVQKLVKVPLRQGTYDALVSFSFNVGPDNLAKSTLLRKLNAGQWHAACDEFPKWKYANKIILEGLVVRRFKEQAMCRKEGLYVYRP